jgi:uncharacterized membrane protein
MFQVIIGIQTAIWHIMEDKYMTNNYTQTQRLTGIAIFAALIIVLQVSATALNYITPGTIPIALAMPLIIIGAALYGSKAGMILGFCFGLVVLGSGITGVAPTSAAMWGINPILMTVGTLGRGIVTGLVAGVVYKWVSKWDVQLGVAAAAVVATITNTAIFTLVLFIFFDLLSIDPAGQSLLQRATAMMVTFNFVLEIAFNLALAPTIVRIIAIVKKVK